MIRDPDTATVWFVRGGERNRMVGRFVTEGEMGVPFPEIPEGSTIDLTQAARHLRRAGVEHRVDHLASLFCSFARGMKPGDAVLMPDPAMAGVVVGWISGDYRFDADLPPDDCRHRRPVEWISRVANADVGDRLIEALRGRAILGKVDDGYARTVVRKAAFDGLGDDPTDRRGAVASRARATPSSRRSAAPKKPPKPVIDTRECAMCLMTKRLELFDGDSPYCTDCA